MGARAPVRTMQLPEEVVSGGEQCDKPDVLIYEPVRKNNAPTFATLYQVVKHTKDRDQKTVMKADRNVLRRLITSCETGRSVDLSSVLKHELLPVPVFLAGSEYHRIDVVFDIYRDEAIKSTNRTRRSKTARPIRRLVEGRDVPLPKNWSNFLSLDDNKADLAHFLSEELCSQAPVDKEIVVAGGFRDELEVKSSTGATDLGPLKSTHEEADTILVLHAVHSQFHTVVVCSRDTDVLLLLVSHIQRMQCQHLWMKSGTSKKRRYIPIDTVFHKLPSGSASSLLAFHALTGYTPPPTSRITGSGHHGRSSKSTMTC